LIGCYMFLFHGAGALGLRVPRQASDCTHHPSMRAQCRVHHQVCDTTDSSVCHVADRMCGELARAVVEPPGWGATHWTHATNIAIPDAACAWELVFARARLL